MGQSQPFSGAESSDWLSTLVETYDRVEQLRSVPCDMADRDALLTHLNRPAINAHGTAFGGSAMEFQR
jgi:hypothetical protein